MAPVKCAWITESRGQRFCVLNHTLRLVLSSNRDHITGTKYWAQAILKCGYSAIPIL